MYGFSRSDSDKSSPSVKKAKKIKKDKKKAKEAKKHKFTPPPTPLSMKSYCYWTDDSSSSPIRRVKKKKKGTPFVLQTPRTRRSLFHLHESQQAKKQQLKREVSSPSSLEASRKRRHLADNMDKKDKKDKKEKKAKDEPTKVELRSRPRVGSSSGEKKAKDEPTKVKLRLRPRLMRVNDVPMRVELRSRPRDQVLQVTLTEEEEKEAHDRMWDEARDAFLSEITPMVERSLMDQENQAKQVNLEECPAPFKNSYYYMNDHMMQRRHSTTSTSANYGTPTRTSEKIQQLNDPEVSTDLFLERWDSKNGDHIYCDPKMADEHGFVLTVGRDPDNQVVVEDPRVSADHFAIKYELGMWTIVDCSTHGTYLNGDLIGKRAKDLVLRHQDVISTLAPQSSGTRISDPGAFVYRVKFVENHDSFRGYAHLPVPTMEQYPFPKENQEVRMDEVPKPNLEVPPMEKPTDFQELTTQELQKLIIDCNPWMHNSPNWSIETNLGSTIGSMPSDTPERQNTQQMIRTPRVELNEAPGYCPPSESGPGESYDFELTSSRGPSLDLSTNHEYTYHHSLMAPSHAEVAFEDISLGPVSQSHVSHSDDVGCYPCTEISNPPSYSYTPISSSRSHTTLTQTDQELSAPPYSYTPLSSSRSENGGKRKRVQKEASFGATTVGEDRTKFKHRSESDSGNETDSDTDAAGPKNDDISEWEGSVSECTAYSFAFSSSRSSSSW